MKIKSGLCLLLLSLSIAAFIACEETEGAGEYDYWQERNDAYIDSIATVAKENADGQWKVFKAWHLPDDDTDGFLQVPETKDYIYVHIVESGAGTVSAMYTDSVSVSYRGYLINEDVFDETYLSEDMNPETAGRTLMNVSSTVAGMATALQYMHEGDQWMLYIPWPLGYGEAGQGSVPAYSNLIFELFLDEINPNN